MGRNGWKQRTIAMTELNWEGKEPCQKKLLEAVTPSESLGCMSLPSADRWEILGMTLVPNMRTMYGIDD